MVALYATPLDFAGYRTFVSGYVVNKNLVNSGVIDVQGSIYNDYSSVITSPISNDALSAIFFPVSSVTSYDVQLIKVYGGVPVRFKFGSLTTLHANVHGYAEYITYEKQVFKNKLCLVNNLPLDFPFDISADTLLEEYTVYSMASWRFPVQTPGFWNEWTACNKVVYDLEKSVIADIAFFYVCYRNFPGQNFLEWFVAGL